MCRVMMNMWFEQLADHERGHEKTCVKCRREGYGVTSTSVGSETWLESRNEGVDSARRRGVHMVTDDD